MALPHWSAIHVSCSKTSRVTSRGHMISAAFFIISDEQTRANVLFSGFK